MTEIIIITAGFILMIAIYVLSPNFINKWSDVVVDVSNFNDALGFFGLVLAAMISYATLRFGFFLAFYLIIEGFMAEKYAQSLVYSVFFLTSLTLGLIFLVATYKGVKALLKK